MRRSWFDTADISEADRLKIGRTNAQKLFGLRSVRLQADANGRLKPAATTVDRAFGDPASQALPSA